MSLALWCVVVAAVLPSLCVGIAKAVGASYDNHDPRAWLDQQQGLARRADRAHRNHFEAFPLFAAGVILASVQHLDTMRLNQLAVLFIVARLIYTALYLLDWSTLRSTVWVIGFATAMAILILGALVPGVAP